MTENTPSQEYLNMLAALGSLAVVEGVLEARGEPLPWGSELRGALETKCEELSPPTEDAELRETLSRVSDEVLEGVLQAAKS